MAQVRKALLVLPLTAALCVGFVAANGPKPRFFDDDPIRAMPAPIPVTKTRQREVNYIYDFLIQSSRPEPRPPESAGAVNTLGEVPDSEWFTNRHGVRRLSREALQRGPGNEDDPVPPFTITGGKSEGITPGFTMDDSKGRSYVAKLDPFEQPGLATGAEVIVSKFLYAIGYNTPKNEIVDVNLPDLRLLDTAKIKLADGRSRRMTWWDVKDMVKRVHREPDGSFRIVASLIIDGEKIGSFRYEGIRRDDPNDTLPHELRRDLRGLYVFAAWLNNTDMRPANTLDMIVEESGIRFIRHYLIDFGSALGSNGDRAKRARSSHQFGLPTPGEALAKIFTVGVTAEPWERVSFPKIPAIGNLVSESFDPDGWKSNYPNPAFLSRLPDDDFWAAKLVMAFTDDDIRAIVETARFSDPQATEYLIATLAKRRDRIGRVFFSKILPLDHFRVENGELVFDDLAVKYGFSAPRQFELRWSRFDNVRHSHDPIGDATSARLPAEATRAPSGSYFSAVIHAYDDYLKRVSIYLRKEENGYKLIGIDRVW
jgi:hypothetical protein